MAENELRDLQNIIDNKAIRTVFQPIISLKDGEVLGHEALSRITCETEINNVETLFVLANKHNCLWELEQICRTRAFEAAFRFMIPPYSKKLFINVNPNVLHDESFQSGLTREYLEQYKIAPGNVIFEITERNIIKDLAGFVATVDHYKRQDYKIAIDDAGAGYSGLNLISEINPNYIKLDMNLTRNINKDNLKAALVKGMVELSKVTNISIIAEGIETEEELESLIHLGVQYGQGFFIQRPDHEVKEIKPDILRQVRELNRRKNDDIILNVYNMPIENLCNDTRTIHAGELVPDVFDIFKQDKDCVGLCIVENDAPIGILTKEKLALKLSGQYGFALYQNKPISHIMDKDFMAVDCKTPVNIVSSVAMSREQDKLYDFIVVKKQGKYLGTITIRDLLKKTTEIEVAAAKHQNPLSGLPGNLIIEQKLQQCVMGEGKYSVAYLDIDNFKAYNDAYGFENGDLILKLLSKVVLKNINSDEFVGHVGGDDFVIIIGDHVEQEFFRNIIVEFEEEVLKFYNQKDIENGYITTTNRRNVVEKFPLITLTLVSVNNQVQRFQDMFELTETLASLKKLKKLQVRVID